MPAGPVGYSTVVGDPRLQSSRTEGAADIDIETRAELQDAKLADFSLALPTGIENQGICAGLRVHNII